MPVETQHPTHIQVLHESSMSPPLHDIEALRYFVEHGLVSEYGVHINSCLKRLSSLSGGTSELHPKVRIATAIACSTGKSMNSVAGEYGVHHNQVASSIRDTLAGAVYLSQSMPQHGVHETVLARVYNLQEIEKTLSVDRTMAEHPAMRKHLKRIPHVQSLVHTYLRDGTVKFLLDDVGVAPYTSYQLRSVRRYLQNPTLDTALDGLSTLATRYSMGRWLWGDGYFTSHSGDELVSLGAAYLYRLDLSGMPEREASRIARMKVFLSHLIEQEFADYQHDRFASEDHGEAFFPSTRGGVAQTAEDIDVGAAYAQYATVRRTLYRLRKYGEMIRDNVPKKERIESMHMNTYYDQGWLETLDWAGVKFLENTLKYQSVNKHMGLERFTQDTTAVLKKAWTETHDDLGR